MACVNLPTLPVLLLVVLLAFLGDRFVVESKHLRGLEMEEEAVIDTDNTEFQWVTGPPSSKPTTAAPSNSVVPTISPTSTIEPSVSSFPTISIIPTQAPTTSSPTDMPTDWPTYSPTQSPSLSPTYFPCLRSYARRDEASTEWNHGTWSHTEDYSGDITVYAPKDTRVGDTLFLFLSRSDDYLPLEINDWTRGGECFKSDNGQKKCFTESDCIERDGEYCMKFNNTDGVSGRGRDLATVMFTRRINEDDVEGCWELDIRGGHTTWATVAAIPNVNEANPIREVKPRSCDGQQARSEKSIFTGVYGRMNDVLLLSQAFDDKADTTHFGPPVGTELLGFSSGGDDAGFLWAKKFTSRGDTGELSTTGPGTKARCKDALLSVVVKRRNV